jgi:hypothetical protein
MKYFNMATPMLSVVLFVNGCSNDARTSFDDTKNAQKLAAGDVGHINNWSPNTENLELAAADDPSIASLDHDVKHFYELLRNRDWKATYKLRSKTFRKDFPEATYLTLANQEGMQWGLSNYDVLSVKTYNSASATIIFKFTELPGPLTSYAAVDWHREEDGVWRCDSAGPDRLTIFIYTRHN